MFFPLKATLKNWRPFKVFSWLRSSYARENIEYVKLLRKCGENVGISNEAVIWNCHMITVGDNVRIHKGVLINAAGGLYIGNNSGVYHSMKKLFSNQSELIIMSR